MERIQRALEMARAQRGSVTELPIAPHVVHGEHSARPEQPRASYVNQPRITLDRAHLRAQRVVLPEDSGSAARAYRMLRAQLLQRARSGNMRVFGVVSGATGEGKTLTAVNLAISLAAEPNQSVTLIDLDLRHPSVTRTLGISPEFGLDTWLSGGQSGTSPLCELEGMPRLSVVPTLAPLAGASEALASERTRELFQQVRSADDTRLVIVDLPPALLSDHVLTVSSLIDGFILVITEGRTRRDDVERVLDLLGRNRIIGTVLNGSSDSEQRAY